MPTTYIIQSKYSPHHSISIHHPSMLWLSINTLRLDSTHPDTYNWVEFNGCPHLWWIPLLTPELLTPELCVTSVTMDQFSLTTRLALSEFQASCYSHHKSQSALGETNWPLRVSGCNLTLNPYLVIPMGHHHKQPPYITCQLVPARITNLEEHLPLCQSCHKITNHQGS